MVAYMLLSGGVSPFYSGIHYILHIVHRSTRVVSQVLILGVPFCKCD